MFHHAYIQKMLQSNLYTQTFVGFYNILARVLALPILQLLVISECLSTSYIAAAGY